MAYPTYITPRSIPGAATPAYLTATLASGYSTNQTLTVNSTAGWYEVSSSGTLSSNPLGTNGIFTLVVDYGSGTEEKILCSGVVSIGSNVPINIWSDGVYNGRGWDGTPISAHASGTNANYNVFPVRTAVDDLQFNTSAITVTNNLATLSGQYNTTSGIVTSHTSSIALISGNLNTVSGVAYAALPYSGGTISGNLVVASGLTVSGTTTLNSLSVASEIDAGSLTVGGNLTVSGSNVLVSGTTANGDLLGTYPNPTVAAIQGKPISVAQATQLSQAGNVVVVGSGSLPRTFTPGEFTVITGTLSSANVGYLPTAPANGTINTIFNNGNLSAVTISGGGTDKIAYGNGTSTNSSTFNIPLGTTTSLTYASGVWYGNGSNVYGTGYGAAVYANFPTLQYPTIIYPTLNSGIIAYPLYTGYVRQQVTNSATVLSSGTSASLNSVYGPYFTYTSNPTYSYPILVANTTDAGTSGHSTTLYLQVNNGSTAYLPSSISVDGYQLSASGSTPSLPINGQASPTYTVTAATGNGTTITYTCANSLTTGTSVNVTGLPVTTGASLNIAGMVVATATATQFTVTNTTVGTSVGSGTATPVRSFTTYYQGGTTWTSATLNAYETYTIQIVNTATNVSIVYLSKVAAGAGTPITGGGTGATTASGALANLGGLPLTGGTISGNLIVASGLTVSGTSTYIGNATFNGSVTVSGNSVLTSASTAGGDLTGTYPNPTLSGTANVQNIISNNSTVTGTATNLATLSGQYATTSGIVTTATGNIASLSGSLATLSGQYVSTSGSLTTLSGQFVSLSGAYATTSGNLNTTNSNLATLSGQFVTLSGSYNTTSGIVTNQTSYISTLSGQMVTANSNIAATSGSLATLSGQFVTLSGSYNTTSGIVTTNTNNIATLSGQMVTANNNIASLSGSLNTVSGVAYAALPRTGGTLTGPLVLSADPTVVLGAATKQYVDAVAQGLSPKESVVATASGNISSLSGPTTIDSISVVSGNRVLLIGQSTASQNGIWLVQPSTWTRPSDFSTGSIQIGTYTLTEQGTQYKGSGFVQTGASIIVDTSAQVWTIFSSAPTGPAGGDLTGTYPSPTLIATGTAGTYGTVSGVPVVTTDPQGRVSTVTVTGIQIAQNQVTGLSGNLSALSGSITTTNINLATLSGQYATTSGIVTNQTGYISTLSGQMVTANANIASTSGSLATLSGQYVTTSGIVTNSTSYIATISGKQVADEANIASISGSLSTVSGVAYAALPKTGGTISGSLTVTGTLSVNSTNIALGANTPIPSANVGGVAVGNYAGQTSNNDGVAVGAYAGSTQNFDGVAVGYEAGYYYNEFGVAIGYLANINNTGSNYTTAIGYQVNATAPGSVAIGTDHTGAGATSSTQDQIVLGTSNHTVNIPGTLTVSGIKVLTSISGVTASGDLQGTYPNPTISTALSGTISTNTTNIATLSGILVTTNSNVATISGKQITDEANIASLSGSLATLSGQYVATSGIVTSNTSNIASTSGSLSTLSGQFVALSGSYNTTSGIVTNQAGYIATISGKQITDEANIASLSGSLVTLSGQFVTTSGRTIFSGTTAGGDLTGTYPNPTLNNTANVSGVVNTIINVNSTVTGTAANLATLSGQFVTLSGQYNTTSGIVTTATGNIASLSGSLNTVSGVAYAALPISGGTISGNLIVASGLTVSGTSTHGGNSTFSGIVTIPNTTSTTVPSSGGELIVGTTLGYSDVNIIQSMASNVNNYNQIILQNTSSGSAASTNFNVSNNLGTSGTNYGEFGINSSNFAGTGAFSIPGNVYLAAASTDLAIGTYGNNAIHFVNNNSANDSMTISSSGLVTIASGLVVNAAPLSGGNYQSVFNAGIIAGSNSGTAVPIVIRDDIDSTVAAIGWSNTTNNQTFNLPTSAVVTDILVTNTIAATLTNKKISGGILLGSTVASGSLTVASGLTVSGTTTLNSLSVASEIDAGSLTVGNNLTVSGTSTLNNTLTISGITITGGTTTSGYVLTATSTSGASFQPASTTTTPVFYSTSGTAAANEISIATAGSITITLPSAPPNGTINTIVNTASSNITLSRGGTDTITYQSTTGIATAGTTYTFNAAQTRTYTYNAGVWTEQARTNYNSLGGTLGLASGGTGATTATAARGSLGIAPATVFPSAHGVKAWTMDPATFIVNATFTPTKGSAYATRIHMTTGATVTTIGFIPLLTVATITGGYVSLYSAAGAVLGYGAITSTTTLTYQTATLTAVGSLTLASDTDYFIVFQWNTGATGATPTFLMAGDAASGSSPGPSANMMNFNTTNASGVLSGRCSTWGTTLNATPAAVTGTPAFNSTNLFATLN